MPLKSPHTPRPHVLLRMPGTDLKQDKNDTTSGLNTLRAQTQYAYLYQTLKKSGIDVTVLPTDKNFPQGYAVGDIAVMAGPMAVLTNFADDHPRQGEQKSLASFLAGNYFLKFIAAPGQLNAADVLKIGSRFFVGLSEKTNHEGAAQLGIFLKDFGYTLTVIDMTEFNTPPLGRAVCDIGNNHILIHKDLERHYAFLNDIKIVISEEQKDVLKSRRIGNLFVMPPGHDAIRRIIEQQGWQTITVDISEFYKLKNNLSDLILELPTRHNATFPQNKTA